MSGFLDKKQQMINPYVYKVTKIVNLVLLLCHAFFCILFYANQAMLLFLFNLGSVMIYLGCFYIIHKNMANLYIAIVYGEIFIFMIVNVICLGWDYGFQFYCISSVIAVLFTDFYTNKEHKLKKATIVSVILAIATFLFLRVWTYRRIPVYSLENELMVHTFFISNALIMFSFLISYVNIYSRTVFELEKSLVDAASKDSLTGLYNRRYMQDILDEVFSKDNVSKRNICMAIMDIDNFKQINDTYGHYMGDAVLISLAKILLQIQNENKDYHICRWGGEEFFILYDGDTAGEMEVWETLEDIRKKVESTEVPNNNGGISYTATIGMTSYQEGVSVSEMIVQADDCLYQGKENGKNRVVVHKKHH